MDSKSEFDKIQHFLDNPTDTYNAIPSDSKFFQHDELALEEHSAHIFKVIRSNGLEL